jgi:hypothetical protein
MAPDGSTPASRKTIKSHTDAIDFEIPTPSLKLLRFTPDELLGKSLYAHLMMAKAIALLLYANPRP